MGTGTGTPAMSNSIVGQRLDSTQMPAGKVQTPNQGSRVGGQQMETDGGETSRKGGF